MHNWWKPNHKATGRERLPELVSTELLDVRFGSEADMAEDAGDVRF